MTGEAWFWIAGIWRPAAGADAWTMLTAEPGPEFAPYHGRQIVVLPHDRAEDWLTGADPESVLAPSPSGALQVERA